MPVAPSLRVRRYASRIHSPSIRWCRDVNTRSGCTLACSAIHCCFVDVFVERSVSSIVSRQWLWTCDAPLPSGGSRWPRFPAFGGTIRALRLPAPRVLRLIGSPASSAGACAFVSASAFPPPCRPDDGPGSMLFTLAIPPSSDLAHGQKQDLPGFLAPHPVTLRRSTTPDDPSRLAARGASGAAPRLTTLKASSLQLSRLTATLRHPLSTLHDARCRTPCKTRFRLAGCAFAGRESNPLGSVERFQINSSSFPGLRLALGQLCTPIGGQY